MRWFADFLRGGSDELGWDDLVRRSVQAIAKLARYGERGRVAFPTDVTVRIEVGEGSVGVVQSFVDDPDLDREVGAALANECDCTPADLPAREYAVSAARPTSVTAAEAPPLRWEIAIEDGDFGGRVLAVPRGGREVRFGRGEWHGADRALRNDLVVCDATEFVSRKAGRLIPSGRRLEVEALDQGDSLSVRRTDGAVVRPARTAKGRVALGAGDTIELSDGKGRAVRLVLRLSLREERERA